MLGENVVSAEGEVWKRHRRITAPAFNHTTYENVWDTTLRVYDEMLAVQGWKDSNVQETGVADFNKITHKVSSWRLFTPQCDLIKTPSWPCS